MRLRNLDSEITRQAQSELIAQNRDTINEIMALTQLRRNHAGSPQDPRWGQPDPIDITGLLENAFRAGMRNYRNQLNAQQEKE